MLVRRERVETVGIKRIARSTFIHTPRHTETGSFGFATSVPSLSFGNVHPKLLGEEFRQGTFVGRGGSRIEFEGVQSDLDRYGNVELGEREIQLLLPQITEGADNVAPDINRECVAHLHHRDIFLHRNGQNRYVTAREISAHDAAALLLPDDTVGLGLGPANPHALLKAMSERKDWSNLTIGGALILGLFELFTHPNVHYRSGFFGPAERYYRSVGGDVQHVPAGFRQFAPILRRLAPRVMMAQATLPDQHGYVSLSLHHGATFDELRADGIGLMTSYGDKWLGDPFFFPVMEELNRRRAVVFVHPAMHPSMAAVDLPWPGFMMEYPFDTTRAAVNLIFTGALQRYPDIRFILSHAGGVLPFIVERFTRLGERKDLKANLPRGVLYELKKFYYEVAQAAHPFALSSLTTLVKTSQILFGTDFPYRTSKEIGKQLAEFGFSAAELAAINQTLRDLEQENNRLRKAVSDLTLDKMILAEAMAAGHSVFCVPRSRATDHLHHQRHRSVECEIAPRRANAGPFSNRRGRDEIAVSGLAPGRR